MKKLLVLGVLIALCIVVSPVLAATITTDKEDYYPWDTVYISGTGFSPSATVSMNVTWPAPDNGIYDVLPPATTNELGAFNDVEYSLLSNVFGIEGTYVITATDSVTGQVATETFTDAPVQHVTTTPTLTITTPIIAGQLDDVSYSGTISASPAVPNLQTVKLEQSSDGGVNYNEIDTSATSGGDGSFSGTFAAPSTSGSYKFRIHFPATGAIDVDGTKYLWDNSFSAVQTITVDPIVTNSPPTASADGPYIGTEGTPIQFDAKASTDSDGSIVSYLWDFDNDGQYDDASGVNPTFTWYDDYAGTIDLKVIDDDGVSDTTTSTVTVSNVAPEITELSLSVAEINENEATTLSGIFTDPGTLDTHKVEIDWGDGSGTTTLNLAANVLTFDSSHQYLDDNPTGTSSDDYTISVAITDDDLGSASDDTTTVTVDNVAPEITDLSLSVAEINENEATTLSGIFTDPGTLDSHKVEIDWGDGSGTTTLNLAANVLTFDSSHQYLDDNPTGTSSDDYTISVAITDDDLGSASDDTTTVTINNVDPTVDAITGVPTDPVKVGTSVSVSAPFSDQGTLDTHTAVWNWGDGIQPISPVSGSVTGSHTYSTAGIYTISVDVTDDDLGSGTSTVPYYLVVYDPSGGFATGGGWINSPARSYAADPTLTGKANFGFVSKYKKGATVPDGTTEFQFKAGSLNFHSSSYDWLVVSGSKATFKGAGTINGAGDYGFMLTARDGTPDTFRIKIWDMATESIVYDNQVGASEIAEPTTILGGGSIVVHK